MKGFVDNIEKLTEENNDFRRVLYTGHNLQLVLMAIQPGDEIGEEVHDDRDQFFRVEGGEGEIWIDGICNKVKADDGIIVPQGARHNVISTGEDHLVAQTSVTLGAATQADEVSVLFPSGAVRRLDHVAAGRVVVSE